MSIKVGNFSKNKLSTFRGVEEPRSKMVDNFNAVTSTNVDKSGREEISNFDNKRTSSDKNRQNTSTGGEGLRSLKVDNFDVNLTCLPRTQITLPNPHIQSHLIGRRIINYCYLLGIGDENYK